MERPIYDADSIFEDVYIYGKLNYDFDNDEITVKSINVTSPSIFTGDVTFSGDITLDEITCRNANVTGVATVGTDLYLNGKLFDADGDFGTAGQILSSDGTDLNWIDASTTSVANANNVGTNANSTDADQFVAFLGANSGNNPVRVNANLRYNPTTGTLSATTFSGGGAVTINTNGDNRIITGSATAGELNGEVSLTYDGTRLNLGDDKKITFGSNLRMEVYTDGSINYIKSATDGGGAFPISINSGSSEVINIDDGHTQIKTGLKDKDGDLGSSGQVLSSTGTQVNWIDVFSGNYDDLSNKPSLFSGNYNDLNNLPTIPTSIIAQARSAIDLSTSTQFNPVGYVDKLTLTVNNVQSTSKILLFFRFTLGHNGSGTTLGRVTGPSLFGGHTTFETGDGRNTHGVLFDVSNSTSRTFKIQYADNGGVSSLIGNAELFAVEIKVS
tara:strand:+ start:291 stop:1619 length:1329 start_codon:yes stop_codon:yes gene_type:complete